MSRYILNFQGISPLPEDDLQLIRTKTQVIDTSHQSVLVEVTSEQVMHELAGQLPNWTVSQETSYPIPSTRPTIRKPPDR
ncbi:hypothetical protein WBJ53_04405 [Spirosoma sp. SC4-14]|uniref:hypothetical protein n=1 Tax=Spirosoma sp. SC4-14 TaxID=3128900 RepID=UPI0030CAE351